MAKSSRTCSNERKELKAAKKEKQIESNRQIFMNNNLNLSNDQIEARQLILNNDITVLIGKAGSGKTFTACYTALKELAENRIGQVIITRPMIGTEDMGFLSGDMNEKYNPWIQPIIQNFNRIFTPAQIKGMMASERISILPLQFTRGMTYDNAYVIIDEAQNLSYAQVKLCLTRIGEGSKIILCGDMSQIDLKKKSDSGLRTVVENEFDKKIENFCIYELLEEHRKQIIIELIREFEIIENKNTNK
jgi:phosphate starvation-inducible protein PhoH